MILTRTCLTLLAVAACAAGDAGAPPLPGLNPGQRPPGPFPEEMFKAADADGDGKVTLAEFTAQAEKRRHEERSKMFAVLDVNHDGSISKDEFLADPPVAPEGEKQGKRRMGPDPEEMFKRFDKNGDGVITSEEMVRRKGDGEKGGKDKGVNLPAPTPVPVPPAAH